MLMIPATTVLSPLFKAAGRILIWRQVYPVSTIQ